MLVRNVNILSASFHSVALRRPGWLRCELMDGYPVFRRQHPVLKSSLAQLSWRGARCPTHILRVNTRSSRDHLSRHLEQHQDLRCETTITVSPPESSLQALCNVSLLSINPQQPNTPALGLLSVPKTTQSPTHLWFLKHVELLHCCRGDHMLQIQTDSLLLT